MNFFKKLFRKPQTPDKQLNIDDNVVEVGEAKPMSFDNVGSRESTLETMTEQEKRELIIRIVNGEFSEDELTNTLYVDEEQLEEAAMIILNHQHASTSLLQRKLKLGYNAAGRIIDILEAIGIVGPFTGSGSRNVLVRKEKQVKELLQNNPFKKTELQLFYEIHYDEIQMEIGKVEIRKELLEKDRKKQLQREVMNELKEEGAVNHISVDTDSRRETITQDVMDKVWNRDGGKCVICGSQEKLEFDHIIPFSKGGANTYRNIQLLCESCNRKKSDKIG
jgi:ribosomal protein S25